MVTAKRLNFSSATNATQIQKFIEANIIHRQGYTYGAPDKKKLIIFIDDINLPEKDKFGVQRCNEVVACSDCLKVKKKTFYFSSFYVK